MDCDTDSTPSINEEGFVDEIDEFDEFDEFHEMSESEWNRYYPIFDSSSEYLFVNKCLTLMHGPLPSYAYYQSNDDITNFWNELEDNYFPIIFNYLIENEFIDIHPEFNNTVSSMKNEVIDFVFSYFSNRV